MAQINAQSVEDFSDRIVYRYTGGRYEQALTDWPGALSSTVAKTLVNTQTSRSYIVPASGISARFYKIEFEIYTAVNLTENAVGANIGLTLARMKFLQISMSSLNFDGKPQVTEFYNEKTELMYTSPQLRAINLGDIKMVPLCIWTDLRYPTAVPYPQFSTGAGTTQLVAIVKPTVTFYKK